jgi:hypothetical protein
MTRNLCRSGGVSGALGVLVSVEYFSQLVKTAPFRSLLPLACYRSNAKMRFQSCFMLITTQPCLLRLVVERLRKGTDLRVGQSLGRAVSILAFGIIVEDQHRQWGSEICGRVSSGFTILMTISSSKIRS